MDQTFLLTSLTCKSTCYLIAINKIDKNVYDFIFGVKIKGLRSSFFARPQTDLVVIGVRTVNNKNVHFTELSETGTNSKAAWGILCRTLKEPKYVKYYVDILYDRIYEYAKKNKLLNLNGCVVSNKEEIYIF